MIWWYRLRRGIACSSRVLLFGGPATIGVGLTVIKAYPEISYGLIGGGVVGVVLLVLQALSEYRHRTYDPTLVFRFDQRFYDKEEIGDARFRAAKTLRDNQGNLRRTDPKLEEIDDLLDFLEDLGFYQHGDQISPEVAHHHFYYWIRGYYLAARDYIEAWQAKPKEPPRWNHIKELFETTSEIEAEDKGKTSLNEKEISKFLDEEIRTFSDNKGSEGTE
jgi:hypothetical protein